MKVLKFGGTSIGSAKMIKKVALLLSNKNHVIVVLSAMSGTTNTLQTIGNLIEQKNISAALDSSNNLKEKYLKIVDDILTEESATVITSINTHFDQLNEWIKHPHSENHKKEILAIGELLISKIFYAKLVEQQLNTTLLPALDFMKINKDGTPDKDFIKEHINQLITKNEESHIYITQGFICRNVANKIDNLKRGGSDYTASLIGQAINAQEIQIWTDISGLHNNDPRFVNNTRPLANISFDEAAELAYFGAKILHPTSILPAKESNIPVLLKNTMAPQHNGTKIYHTSEQKMIKAIAAKDNITAIKIRSGHMLLAYGFLSEVFDIFKIYKTPIDMITTSEVAVSLTIDDTTHLSEIKQKLKKYGQVIIDEEQVIICIVGNLIAQNKGIAYQVLHAVKNIPLRMISYGGSNHNISLLINKNDKRKALNTLSNKLLNKPWYEKYFR